ncbi:MAG TPA: ATP-binding protein [Candidatus Tectomicrobia bacterium]|nr:ATP-binding protein [Candidatus Tectomicrobia bacterium]
MLILGPVGARKSMSTTHLSTILRAMTLTEALETTSVRSIASLTGDRTILVSIRP